MAQSNDDAAAPVALDLGHRPWLRGGMQSKGMVMPDPLAGWPGASPAPEPARPIDPRKPHVQPAAEPDPPHDAETDEKTVDDERVDANDSEGVR
jgi:hypothetical protein